MQIVDIIVNCPSIDTADTISAALIEQRLVACSNRYAPIQSAYFWKGKVEQEQEHPLLLKTRRELAQQVEEAIRALHPYEVPSILRIDIDGANLDYIDWVYTETRTP